VLHAGTFSDPAWFEHDTRAVAWDVLMNCAHLAPEVKAEARQRKLRNMLNGLDATVMTLSSYCVWCGDHYQGGSNVTGARPVSTASKKLTGRETTAAVPDSSSFL
jgi:hypothetical protein